MPQASCLGVTTPAAAVILELLAGAQNGFWLQRVYVTLTSANAAQLSLKRTTVKGITPTLVTPVQFEGPGVNARYAYTWGTPPTVTGQASIWSMYLPATAGANTGMDFTIGRNNNQAQGIWVPPNGSISFQSVLATGNSLITCLIYEP